MNRASLFGLLFSLVACTAEPGVGFARADGDTARFRAHEIQTDAEARTVVRGVSGTLLPAVLEGSAEGRQIVRGLRGTAMVSGNDAAGTVTFDDFAFRVGTATMTLSGDLSYRRDAQAQLSLEAWLDLQWSNIADTITTDGRTLTNASGQTFAL